MHYSHVFITASGGSASRGGNLSVWALLQGRDNYPEIIEHSVFDIRLQTLSNLQTVQP